MPYNGKPHLFAIMNDPDAAGCVLAVMVTSIKEGRTYDGTCVLNIGDHDFIKHPSYIAYVIAETPRVIHIEKMVAAKYFNCDEDFERSIIQRIAAGIYASDETKDRIYNYSKQLNI